MQCLKNLLHALLKFSFSQYVTRVNNQVSCKLSTMYSIESLFPNNILASCCNEHGNCCKAVSKGQSQGHFYCSCLSQGWETSCVGRKSGQIVTPENHSGQKMSFRPKKCHVRCPQEKKERKSKFCPRKNERASGHSVLQNVGQC